LTLTHLLAVNTPVIRLDDDEALAGDVQPGALDLLDVGGVLVRGDDFLHFGGRDGEADAGRPDAVAGVVEDGGAVDVAGADEAGVVGRVWADVGYLVSTYAAHVCG
jgi:hypothetical protein